MIELLSSSTVLKRKWLGCNNFKNLSFLIKNYTWIMSNQKVSWEMKIDHYNLIFWVAFCTNKEPSPPFPWSQTVIHKSFRSSRSSTKQLIPRTFTFQYSRRNNYWSLPNNPKRAIFIHAQNQAMFNNTTICNLNMWQEQIVQSTTPITWKTAHFLLCSWIKTLIRTK